MAVRADLGPKLLQGARVPDILVIYIRAVAVRQDFQGSGLGTALLIDVMRRCGNIANQMGVAAIVLDVLKDAVFERRWAFYTRLGFQSLYDAENPTRVFVSLADVRRTRIIFFLPFALPRAQYNLSLSLFTSGRGNK